MSAPDTNIEKQSRRHAPSLWGMAIAVTVAFIAAVLFFFWQPVPEEDVAAPATGPVVEEGASQ